MDNSLDSYLLKDEKVFWIGKPEMKVIFDPKDRYHIPMTLLGNIIIVYSISHDFDLKWAIIWILIGFYLLMGRFIYKAFNKKATLYVVTNQRIIIINKLWGYFIEKSIKSITHIEKEIRPNGIGTIRFGHTPSTHLWYENTGLEVLVGPEKIYGTPAPTFFDIKDANMIYQLVKELI